MEIEGGDSMSSRHIGSYLMSTQSQLISESTEEMEILDTPKEVEGQFQRPKKKEISRRARAWDHFTLYTDKSGKSRAKYFMLGGPYANIGLPTKDDWVVVERLTRDVLAMPISTVASESVFSIGGRIIDDFRASLTPKMAQALICCQDWLRHTLVKSLEEDYEFIQRIEKDMVSNVGMESNILGL